MLGEVKSIIHMLLPYLLFGGGIFMMFLTIFKKAEWGLFLLIFLIPQPNIWYKFHVFPLGKDFMDLLFFSVLLGLIFNKEGIKAGRNGVFLIFFVMISYFALWNSSIRFDLPSPITLDSRLLSEWKNYAQMILLYFLAMNITRDEEQQKTMIIILTVAILILGVRDFRNFSAAASFSYEKRSMGPFFYVGLGSNQFAAFIVHFSAALLGLFLVDKHKIRRRLYLAALLFCLHPLFFAYSRGAYLAAFVALAFYGVIKKRSLLVMLVVIAFFWEVLLPSSVIERIAMTQNESGEIESSAAQRLVLWEHAVETFKAYPVFGVGFNGFGFTLPKDATLTDTHNFYLKTLCEQGVVGIVFFAILLLKAFSSGWRLYKIGRSDFHRGLGLGLTGCVLALMTTNLFGDRWSYYILGGYFFILWGIVDRAILLSENKDESAMELQKKSHSMLSHGDKVSMRANEIVRRP